MKFRPLLLLSAFLALLSVSCFGSLKEGGASNVGKTVPAAQLDFVANKADTAGKPYILEFWATWCGPCRQSIPHLNQVYAKFKDRGLLIVGVSDEEPALVKEFMKKLPMNYAVAIDASGSLGTAFGIRGIPHALVVDKTGKIVWEGHPMELEDSTIEKVLK
jgi:thiol-disulfide isomerase/thioredoxin